MRESSSGYADSIEEAEQAAKAWCDAHYTIYYTPGKTDA